MPLFSWIRPKPRPTQLDRIENRLHRIELQLEAIRKIPQGMTEEQTQYVTRRLINAARRLNALRPKQT